MSNREGWTLLILRSKVNARHDADISHLFFSYEYTCLIVNAVNVSIFTAGKFHINSLDCSSGGHFHVIKCGSYSSVIWVLLHMCFRILLNFQYFYNLQVTFSVMSGSLQRPSFPPSRWTPNVANTNIRAINSTKTWKETTEMAGSLQRPSFPPSRWTPNVANTNIRAINSTNTCTKHQNKCIFHLFFHLSEKTPHKSISDIVPGSILMALDVIDHLWRHRLYPDTGAFSAVKWERIFDKTLIFLCNSEFNKSSKELEMNIHFICITETRVFYNSSLC